MFCKVTISFCVKIKFLLSNFSCRTWKVLSCMHSGPHSLGLQQCSQKVNFPAPGTGVKVLSLLSSPAKSLQDDWQAAVKEILTNNNSLMTIFSLMPRGILLSSYWAQRVNRNLSYRVFGWVHCSSYLKTEMNNDWCQSIIVHC